MTLYGKFHIKFHKKWEDLLCIFYCFLILCTHWASGEINYFEVGAFMLLSFQDT
jgi:hypothetical protein